MKKETKGQDLPAIEGGKPALKKFIPYGLHDIGPREIRNVVSTLKTDLITTGPRVAEFEKKFAKFVGCKHAVALNSCTAALHVSLAAAGIGPGDEVITTPLTMVATANAIEYVGAKPVFADVRKDTYNIDPKEIEKKITKRTRAIIPVHYAGQPADMDEIRAIAKKHGLAVIEDAAHAVSAKYKRKNIGTLSLSTCFSFHPVKNMTTCEGGMITTASKEFAQRAKRLRLFGISRDFWNRFSSGGSWYYEMTELGFKYNMTDLQASLGLAQLERLKSFQKKREAFAKIYTKAFSDVPEIVTPHVEKNVKHAWHIYTILIRPELLKIDRNKFIDALKAENVGTSVHYIPVHYHPYYAKKYGFRKGDFPNAEYVYERTITIPLFPRMKREELDGVIRAVRRIANHYRKN